MRAQAIAQPPDIGIQFFQLILSILCKDKLCQLKSDTQKFYKCARTHAPKDPRVKCANITFQRHIIMQLNSSELHVSDMMTFHTFLNTIDIYGIWNLLISLPNCRSLKH